jgi:hypothetical protein
MTSIRVHFALKADTAECSQTTGPIFEPFSSGFQALLRRHDQQWPAMASYGLTIATMANYGQLLNRNTQRNGLAVGTEPPVHLARE